MVAEKLDKVTISNLVAGIQDQAPDIIVGDNITLLPLNSDSINWSFGKRVGMTTRYGIWPIAGHATNEEGDTAITNGPMNGKTLRGLMASEQAVAANGTNDLYSLRTNCFGCIILQLPVSNDRYSGAKNSKTTPVAYWLNARQNALTTAYQIDLCPSTEKINTGFQMHVASNFEAGIGSGSAVFSKQGTETSESTLAMHGIDRLHTVSLSNLRKVKYPVSGTEGIPKFIRWTVLQATIDTNITEFVAWRATANATHDWASVIAPNIGMPDDVTFQALGMPYWMKSISIDKKNISIDAHLSASNALNTSEKAQAKAYFSTNVGDLNATYTTCRGDTDLLTGYLPTSTGILNLSSLGTYKISGIAINPTNVTGWNVNGTSFTPTTQVFIRTNDQPLQVPISVVAMVVQNKPVIALANPYLRDSTEDISNPTSYAGNDFLQWLNPTNNFYKPRVYNTYESAAADGITPYTEAWPTTATPVQTCWGYAPKFVHGLITTNVTTSNAGGLKAKTVYEYAYSIYNAMTGKESNVGVPAKVFVDADGSSIVISTSGQYHGYAVSNVRLQFPGLSDVFAEVSPTPFNIPINYLSYRVYYREVGSFEWLFAGDHSFAKVYFDNNSQAIFIGSGSNVGLPGGQPGGYIDNSDLPEDEYSDVTSFQDRLFWLTKGMVRWSSSNNAFVYSLRNYAACPAGEFRGMIVHYFAGQAKQDGRLVIFGSEGTYDLRRSDTFQYQQVRVSASAPPVSVPLEGSDIVVSTRGSDTAFSGRCACVAEGVVYFWGSTGVFRDDGVGLPVRISQGIEPSLFETYDRSKTTEFFAYYNKRSREILFFYRPIDTSIYQTLAWVYSVRTEAFSRSQGMISNIDTGTGLNNPAGAWSQYGYKQLIDWAQDIDLTGFETPTKVGGSRTLIGSRSSSVATVSRPYFHDDDCEGGDYYPGGEMMVKTISIPVAGTLRLAFALGFSQAIINASPVGTMISIKGSSSYGGLPAATNIDTYCQITNKGAGYIEVAIASFSAATQAYLVATLTPPALPPAPKTFVNATFFPVFIAGYHDIMCNIVTNSLAPMGIEAWNMFRYMHILLLPVATTQGAGIPTASASWECNHYSNPTPDLKNFPLTKLHSGEISTQVVMDLTSTKMNAEGQGIAFTISYNQLVGRWTLYAFTLYYAHRGTMNLMMYQRPNA